MGLRLTVAAQGGLCNRLRVVLSALHFSRTSLQETEVTAVWHPEAECQAAWTDLFHPLADSRFKIINGGWADLPIRRSNLHLPGVWRSLFYTRQFPLYEPTKSQPLSSLADGGRYYLSGCSELCPYPPELTAEVRPLPFLQKRIDELAAEFAHHRTVGIHARRSDNIEARRTSTDAAFIKAIEAESPTTHFFLATDDDMFRQRLNSMLGNRLLSQQRTVRRDTTEGMADAVVDLFLLSRTEKILGSYWSSFSDTAAEIGGKPLVVVTDSNQQTTLRDLQSNEKNTFCHKQRAQTF